MRSSPRWRHDLSLTVIPQWVRCLMFCMQWTVRTVKHLIMQFSAYLSWFGMQLSSRSLVVALGAVCNIFQFPQPNCLFVPDNKQRPLSSAYFLIHYSVIARQFHYTHYELLTICAEWSFCCQPKLLIDLQEMLQNWYNCSCITSWYDTPTTSVTKLNTWVDGCTKWTRKGNKGASLWSRQEVERFTVAIKRTAL